MNMPRLEDLAGLPPSATPRTTVLRYYHLIEGARRRGWRWHAIAAALELSEPAAKKAFARVQRQIAAGRLDPEALKGPPPPTPNPAPAKRRQILETQARPQAEEQNAETLRAMGVEIIGESK